jgi:glycosyltransferase involved in cell wall biosynthesis
VVNEAMAVGLPILGSIYSQAVTELVEDGQNGWQFDPAAAQSVQDALDRIRNTPPERIAEMRQSALRRISVVTPEGAASKIFDVLCKVARPRWKGGHLIAAKPVSDVAEST